MTDDADILLMLPTTSTISVNATNLLNKKNNKYEAEATLFNSNLDLSAKFEHTINKVTKNTQNLVTSEEKLKINIGPTERFRKRSWCNLLYPNYKDRSKEFNSFFKPNGERLIVDYSCALFSGVLLQGRIYISQNFICFNTNLFGWEKCLVIRFKDIINITRQTTAILTPNAISISTDKENNFFASFTARDATYTLLLQLWQNALLHKRLLPQKLWQLVHDYYGDELGLTTEDDDYFDPIKKSETVLRKNTNINLKCDKQKYRLLNANITSKFNLCTKLINNCNFSNSGNSRVNSNRDSDKCFYTTDINYNLKYTKAKTLSQSMNIIFGGKNINIDNNTMNEFKYNVAQYDGKGKITKSARHRDECHIKNSDNIPTDMSDSSDSEVINIPFVATAECNSSHEGRQLVHTILPINIETLFKLLFSKSKFLLDFHKMRKSSDLNFTEWCIDADGNNTRTFNVTVQLTASVGPKTSKVTEHQVMRDCSKSGELYSIDISTINAGIPYADSFMVLIHYCLVKTVDDHTMLSVHAQIKFKKTIWGVVKGFIEKNTWDGLENFFTALLHSLQSEICIPPAKGKGRRARRGTANQMRSFDEMPLQQNKSELLLHHCNTSHKLGIRSNLDTPITTTQSTIKCSPQVPVITVILLCFFVLLNVLLFIKLWGLERRIDVYVSDETNLSCMQTLSKRLYNSKNEWKHIWQQQGFVHETELKLWQTTLQVVIQMIKNTSLICHNLLQNANIIQEITKAIDEH